jgi:hypothetical protein
MSRVASREKWSFSATTVVPGGRLPTQRACPDCFGFLGGPRGTVLIGPGAGIPSNIVSRSILQADSWLNSSYVPAEPNVPLNTALFAPRSPGAGPDGRRPAGG